MCALLPLSIFHFLLAMKSCALQFALFSFNTAVCCSLRSAHRSYACHAHSACCIKCISISFLKNMEAMGDQIMAVYLKICFGFHLWKTLDAIFMPCW